MREQRGKKSKLLDWMSARSMWPLTLLLILSFPTPRIYLQSQRDSSYIEF